MRYSKEHKQETHARIVKKASIRLREKGAHGIGVADLMKEAGLTHGGFYAHFDSREALVIEAFNYAMDRATERWRKMAEQTPPEKRLASIRSMDLMLKQMHQQTVAPFGLHPRVDGWRRDRFAESCRRSDPRKP